VQSFSTPIASNHLPNKLYDRSAEFAVDEVIVRIRKVINENNFYTYPRSIQSRSNVASVAPDFSWTF
jgi:hypothetical protein